MNILLIASLILIAYVILQYIYSNNYLKIGRKLAETKYQTTAVLGNKNNPPLKLFITGDSVGAGVGADSFDTSLSGRTANYLAEKYFVSFKNESISGSKMGDLLNMPRPSEKQDIIVLVISSNDLFRFTDLKQFKKDTKSVIEMYQPLAKKIIILGPGRVFDAEAIPVPLRIIYKIMSSKYTNIISSEISHYNNIVQVDLTKTPPSKAKYGKSISASDQFHPDNIGHSFWFDSIKPQLNF